MIPLFAMSLTMTYQLREATQDDLPRIVEIYNQNVLGKQATADLVPVSVADRQAWFDVHSMANNRPLMVAMDSQHQIVGWVSLSNLYDRPAYHISCEISVYVDNSVKNQGLGQFMVEQMLAIAPTLGIRQVVALIFSHNLPSIRLFEKMGFAHWGKFPQCCDMNGFIADVSILGKSL